MSRPRSRAGVDAAVACRPPKISAFPQGRGRLLRSYSLELLQKQYGRAETIDRKRFVEERVSVSSVRRQCFIGRASAFHRSPEEGGVSVSSGKPGAFPQFWTTLAVSVSSVSSAVHDRRKERRSRPSGCLATGAVAGRWEDRGEGRERCRGSRRGERDRPWRPFGGHEGKRSGTGGSRHSRCRTSP